MTLVDLTNYLTGLRVAAGGPTVRQIAAQAHLGKTTVSGAFAGRKTPTWAVTSGIVKALSGNEVVAQRLWAAAARPPQPRTDIPPWLTDVQEDPPRLVAGHGFESACALAATDPRQAVEAAWEAVRLTAVSISHRHYADIPGNWTSNIVATYERAEADGKLPGGSTATAHTIHRYYLTTRVDPNPPPVSTAMQVVVLAYRLAWEAWKLVASSIPSLGYPDDQLRVKNT
ncbi:hypothetical protein ACFYUY_04340 [Kitasatospora sp. NPDC004745]|uniref:hypothetical protein n=1 Tax=Kitasatospora sp. NPDC004745 TaxID=3364019 RepID=UPI0036AAB47A